MSTLLILLLCIIYNGKIFLPNLEHLCDLFQRPWSPQGSSVKNIRDEYVVNFTFLMFYVFIPNQRVRSTSPDCVFSCRIYYGKYTFIGPGRFDLIRKNVSCMMPLSCFSLLSVPKTPRESRQRIRPTTNMLTQFKHF